MSSENEVSRSEQETLIGGREVTVFSDGKAEKILIGQLKVKDLTRGTELLMSETALIEAVTGKTKEWVEALPMRAFSELAKNAREVNTDFFESVHRQVATIEKVMPGGIAELLARRTMAQPSSSTPLRKSLYAASPGGPQ